MIRALSQLEQALTISNSAYPLSAVNVLKLTKGPSVYALQSSIDQLQKHYPFLRANIKEKNGRYWFEEDLNWRPLEIQLKERVDDSQWLEITRMELNKAIDHSTSPLMRILFLKSAAITGKSEIILSFHHAIMDSAFLMPFINQLLAMAGKEEPDDKKLNPAPSLPVSPSPLLRDVLPLSYRMPALLFHLLPFLFTQLKNELVYKKRSGKVKDTHIPASSENDILTLSFSEKETVSLIKWSRKNKLSLNSIITAAMLLLVNRYNYKNRKEILRTIQFATLRPYLIPPVEKHVEGSFIAMMRFDIPIAPGSELITVAKYINKQIIRSGKRGDKFLFSLLSKTLIKKSLREKKDRLSATALSYAGPLQLKEQYGLIKVSDMHGFITNNCLGPEISGFGKICFNRLSLDLNFLSEETPGDKAQKMTKELKSSLLHLISDL